MAAKRAGANRYGPVGYGPVVHKVGSQEHGNGVFTDAVHAGEVVFN